ncbi:MAG: hypothetical protein ACE5QV_02625 [Fidelibacterota bacterium]
MSEKSNNFTKFIIFICIFSSFLVGFIVDYTLNFITFYWLIGLTIGIISGTGLSLTYRFLFPKSILNNPSAYGFFIAFIISFFIFAGFIGFSIGKLR